MSAKRAMKILCLHGNGTNSHIMKTQTAALRYELGEEYTYEFVEAVQTAPIAEGMSEFSQRGSSYFEFYNDRHLSSLHTSLEQLESYIDAEGPFDAAMGFSAGAVLIAAYLLSQPERSLSARRAPFKAAIFLSSAPSRNVSKFLDLKKSQGLIDIPTAHIWGSHDTKLTPGGGLQICELSERQKRFSYIHEGGHELPKKEEQIQAVHVIRRVLQSAR